MQLGYPVRRHSSRSSSLTVKALGFLGIAILLSASTSVFAFHQQPVHNDNKQAGAESSQKHSGQSDQPSEINKEAFDNVKLLDVAALVRESDVNGSAMHKQLLQYTYSLKKIRRALNGRGKVIRQGEDTFEAYPVRGQHVLIQIARNGKPLMEWEVSDARRRAGEELLKAERASQKSKDKNKAEAQLEESASYIKAGIVINDHGKSAAVSIDLSEFLRSCEFSSPRVERVGEREMVALDFKPRADADFSYVKRFMTKLVGTVWIDANDRVVARLEGRVVPQGAVEADAPALETALLYEQARLSTGFWFPRTIRIKSADGALFNGLQWDVMFEFSDYKQFTSTIENIKIKEPDKKEDSKVEQKKN